MVKVLVFLLLLYSFVIECKKAVFIEPFTDLGINMVCKDPFFDSLTPNTRPRAHQALFNEICEVLEEKGDAVRVVLPNIVYKEKSKNEPSDFWAPRSAFISFDDLAYKIESSVFPNHGAKDGSTIVLTMPFYDKITKKTYSAGTRFVRTHKDTPKFYGVILYDVARKKKVQSRVAKQQARIETNVCLKDAQKEFVKLLYVWATMPKVIPYVWGGSSFIYTQKDGDYTIDKNLRITYNNNLPITGYDCSELVLRAAQICGLPYFCKVTFLMPEHLRTVQADEELAEGDLLWYPGHVMVVGSIERNELIESRGYSTGYGKVHAIELNKLFPEIKNYDELKKKCFNKEPITLVNKDGSFHKNITDFRIFKLSSAWEQ